MHHSISLHRYLYLGSFQHEDEAARMFDLAAIKLRGTKAKTNFPLETYMDHTGKVGLMCCSQRDYTTAAAILPSNRMHNIANRRDSNCMLLSKQSPCTMCFSRQGPNTTSYECSW